MPIRRFYLPSSGSAPIPTATVGTWTAPINKTILPLNLTKGNTALTDTIFTWPDAATRNNLLFQYISPKLNVEFVWNPTDTLSFVMGGLESAALADSFFRLCLRGVSDDGTQVASVWINNNSIEFGTAYQTRTWVNLAISGSTVTFPAGSRLSVELGVYGSTPQSLSTTTIRTGDPTATADYALTANLTTEGTPWVEFNTTQSIVFQGESSVTDIKKITSDILNTISTVSRISLFSKVVNESLNLVRSSLKWSGSLVVRIKNETIQLIESRLNILKLVRRISDSLSISTISLRPRTIRRIINNMVALGSSKLRTFLLVKIYNDLINMVESKVRNFILIKVVQDTLSLLSSMVTATTKRLGKLFKYLTLARNKTTVEPIISNSTVTLKHSKSTVTLPKE